jgi:lysophospholipase L1-like esterase
MAEEISTEKSPVLVAPDIRPDFNKRTDLKDGIHPTESGYQKMVFSCSIPLETYLS